MKRRTLYHCSEVHHGETWTPRPRLPRIVDDKEPPVPRVCVAPSVPACFASRLFLRQVYVYKTYAGGVRPRGVWDAMVTRERWIVHPVEFRLVRTIPVDVVRKVTEAVRIYHDELKKRASLRTRVCQYAITVDLLGATAWERNWVKDCLGVLKIKDPELYLLEAAWLAKR